MPSACGSRNALPVSWRGRLFCMRNFTYWSMLSTTLLLVAPFSMVAQYKAGKNALNRHLYPKALELFTKAGKKSEVLMCLGKANYFSDQENPDFHLETAYRQVLLAEQSYSSLKTKAKEKVRKSLGKDRPMAIRSKIEKLWFTDIMANPHPKDLRLFTEIAQRATPAQRRAIISEWLTVVIARRNPDEIREFLNVAVQATPEQRQSAKQVLLEIDYTEKVAFVKAFAPSDEAFLVLQQMLSANFKSENWQAVRDTMAVYMPLFAQKNSDFQDLYDRVSNQDRQKKMTPIRWADGKNHEGYVQVLSGDGRQMYFCSSVNGSEDIFYSRQTDGVWSTPVPVTELNTPINNEAVMDISVNGTEMLLFVNGDIFKSIKTENGWQTPTILPAGINSSFWESDAHFFSGGIIFVSTRNGNMDLFVTRYGADGKTLEAPFSLGNTVNTSGSERSPFLHPDGKTLYFASNRSGGFGSTDIFVSRRLDDTWLNWSTPHNLGMTINSENLDWSFLVTTDGTQAYGTILLDKTNFITTIDLPAAFRPDSVFTFETKVLDSNGKPINGEIVIYDIASSKIVQIVRPDPLTGSVFIPMAEKKNFRAELRNAGAPPITLPLDFSQPDVNHIKKDILVAFTTEELQRTGANMRINNLFFETGSHVILEQSQLELDALAAYFKENQLSVEIHGHTDDIGSKESNQLLSEKRAVSVRDYLISRGCTPEKVKAIGHGESLPVEPNATELARQKNRRVEFKLI